MKTISFDKLRDNYELVVDYDKKRFLNKNPWEMAKATQLTIKEDLIIVPHFHIDYTVDIKTAEIAYADNRNAPIDVNKRMVILHHLIEAKPNAKLAGEFVTMQSLKDANIHSEAFKNRSIIPLSKAFNRDLAGFIKAGEILHGQATHGGDHAFILYAFPTIPLKCIFWDGDDEVPAAANILFDQNITDFTHPEDAIGLGDMCAQHIIESGKENH